MQAPHYRREILTQAFPRQVVNKLCSIYKCDENEERKRAISYESIRSMNLEHNSDETVCSRDYVSKRKYDTPYDDAQRHFHEDTQSAGTLDGNYSPLKEKTSFDGRPLTDSDKSASVIMFPSKILKSNTDFGSDDAVPT